MQAAFCPAERCRDFDFPKLPTVQPGQRHLRRMIATHAMHSSTRWSGCRAKVDFASGRGVMSPCRSKEKLTNVHDAASDITSHQVSVQALKIRGRKHTPRQNAFAKARSEALNLIFQSF